jgi:hypothetical protein
LSGSCRASQRSFVAVKLAAGLLDQFPGRVGGTGVVPQQRRADHLA